jgi:hypothetical protein
MKVSGKWVYSSSYFKLDTLLKSASQPPPPPPKLFPSNRRLIGSRIRYGPVEGKGLGSRVAALSLFERAIQLQAKGL